MTASALRLATRSALARQDDVVLHVGRLDPQKGMSFLLTPPIAWPPSGPIGDRSWATVPNGTVCCGASAKAHTWRGGCIGSGRGMMFRDCSRRPICSCWRRSGKGCPMSCSKPWRRAGRSSRRGWKERGAGRPRRNRVARSAARRGRPLRRLLDAATDRDRLVRSARRAVPVSNSRFHSPPASCLRSPLVGGVGPAGRPRRSGPDRRRRSVIAAPRRDRFKKAQAACRFGKALVRSGPTPRRGKKTLTGSVPRIESPLDRVRSGHRTSPLLSRAGRASRRTIAELRSTGRSSSTRYWHRWPRQGVGLRGRHGGRGGRARRSRERWGRPDG